MVSEVFLHIQRLILEGGNGMMKGERERYVIARKGIEIFVKRVSIDGSNFKLSSWNLRTRFL